MLCLAGAAVMQGVLAGFPVMVWGPVPVTVPVSAVVIALVGLRRAPQWGPVFAATAGLLADAAGAGLLGTTAWAYVPVAAAFAFVHRHLRRDHPLTLILYASAQALVQTGGTYLGLRLGGFSGMPGHLAAASICLSSLLALAAAGATATALRFAAALRRHAGDTP
jgi:cell shape-determining protein MreD